MNKTVLETLLTESKLPPVSLELDTQSILKLSLALLLVAALAIMLHQAITRTAK